MIERTIVVLLVVQVQKRWRGEGQILHLLDQTHLLLGQTQRLTLNIRQSTLYYQYQCVIIDNCNRFISLFSLFISVMVSNCSHGGYFPIFMCESFVYWIEIACNFCPYPSATTYKKRIVFLVFDDPPYQPVCIYKVLMATTYKLHLLLDIFYLLSSHVSHNDHVITMYDICSYLGKGIGQEH